MIVLNHCINDSLLGNWTHNRGAHVVSKTYAHLFGQYRFHPHRDVSFKTGMAETIARALTGVSWLLVLGGLSLISCWEPSGAIWRHQKVAQYGGNGRYVLAESIILSRCFISPTTSAPGAITSAAAVTFLAFASLTAIVFLRQRISHFCAAFCYGAES